MDETISSYMILIKGYLAGAYSLERFSELYFELFKNEQSPLFEEAYGILDKLFGDLDAFTTNERLLQSDPDYYLGAEQVRHCIWCAYEALKGC
ncbi:hypothetical protein HU751_007970 [Pseudomonas sp. BW13M1]|uniref:Colicin D immunity protein domain-containing protein n=1 Tax=Pseudomonas peradeniyensis TaxID=2745488 RepID=A0A923K1X5_9PSED|nr:colicin immunity domain-containing protein [Pseudomonas peradeniyensis]MBV4504784.1 hypothetical protein [Pseudomonas peradeniyensis]